MKQKNNQIRTYDRDGFKKRAACVCFRDGAEDEVCILQSFVCACGWAVYQHGTV